MSAPAQETTRARTVALPDIREHKIPTPGSKPYIAIEGPDGCLWFCESGTSKIGRFDATTATFTEYDLPTSNATPIGITLGADGNLWFAEKTGNKIGRMTPSGATTEFPVPTQNAGQAASHPRTDRNGWASETEVS